MLLKYHYKNNESPTYQTITTDTNKKNSQSIYKPDMFWDKISKQDAPAESVQFSN